MSFQPNNIGNVGYNYTYNIIIYDLNKCQQFLSLNGFNNINYLQVQNTDTVVNTTTELSADQQTLLNTLVLSTYTNPLPVTSDEGSIISALNSTDTILTANQSFTGTFELIKHFSTLSVFAYSDSDSAPDGLVVEFSMDGVHVHHSKTHTLKATKSYIDFITIFSSYFRVRYTNGDRDEQELNIHCMLSNNRVKDITDTTQEQIISVREQTYNAETSGSFRCETLNLTIPANSTVSESYTWGINIAPLVVKFISLESQYKNKINLYVAKNTPVGTLTQNLTPGQNILHVTDTVLDKMKRGYECTITDGTNFDNLGQVLDINIHEKTITIKSPTTLNNYYAGMCYVQLTIHIIKDFMIGHAGQYSIGESKIGASYVPAGIPVTLEYQNTSNEEIDFIWSIDLLY